MTSMPEESREWLEAECLRVARQALGCGDLKQVTIKRVHPPGSGPNWYVKKFFPALPPIAEAEARRATIGLTGTYAYAQD